jgi:hypothetical protein
MFKILEDAKYILSKENGINSLFKVQYEIKNERKENAEYKQ